jgi:DNA anti-recombination protein RmuC
VPFIAIIIALTISLLTGCVDREKQILEQNNYDLARKNERLIQIVNDQEQQIRRYQSGLDEKWEKERQFREQLSVEFQFYPVIHTGLDCLCLSSW